jgi:hypothetical protein
MINFPSNPTLNQVYTFGVKTWKWNGRAWDLQTISDVQVQRAETAATNAQASANALRVADYAALRSLTANVPVVYVSGYATTTSPSGIAGTFVRDDADTTSLDNAATVIVDSSGRRWKRQYSGAVLPQWFGARGDGVTDDTAAIQAALDASYAVFLPNGRYKITSPLIFDTSVTLTANKRGATIVAGSGFAAGNISRTYVDSNSVTQTLTWNDKAAMYLVCPNNSYLTDVTIDGVSFDLPSDGSIGAINGKRICYSNFSNLFCNYSAYFAKGYDMWEIGWENIRSRFSKDHFNLDTGTSNTFTNVACDTKNSSGGTGFTFKNLNYSFMSGCAADSLDRCYYFDNSNFVVSGCGAESFSRIAQAVNGAQVTFIGGALEIWKISSFTGTATPYDFSGANTKIKFFGTWLGIRNPASAGGNYDKMAITGGADVVMDGRGPTEIASKWWYIAGTDSALTVKDSSTGVTYYNQYGASRRSATSSMKAFETTKTIAAGSAQGIFRINNASDGSSYGANCFGEIKVMLLNSYNPDIGFVGAQTYQFACYRETTTAQNLVKVGDATAVTNTGGAPLGTITGVLVRNADNTIDFQITIPSSYGTTTVTVFVEYMNNVGGNPASEVITSL